MCHAGLFFGIDVGLEGMSPIARRAMALDLVNALRDGNRELDTARAIACLLTKCSAAAGFLGSAVARAAGGPE